MAKKELPHQSECTPVKAGSGPWGGGSFLQRIGVFFNIIQLDEIMGKTARKTDDYFFRTTGGMRGKRPLLRTLILWRVLPGTAILLVMALLSVRFLAIQAVGREVENSLLVQAEQAAEILNRRLLTLVSTVRGLSRNELMKIGLTSTGGQNTYLGAFLKSLQLPGGTNCFIALVDGRGRVVAGNREQTGAFDRTDWFSDVLSGREYMSAGRTGMRIAMPVPGPQSPRGLLLVEYEASALADLLAVTSPGVAYLVVENDNTILFSSSERFQGGYDTRIEGWLSEITFLRAFPNLLVISAKQNAWAFAPVSRLDSFLVMSMLLALGALALGIVFASLLATRPLSILVEEIGSVSGTEHLVRPDLKEKFRSREFYFLAEAFDTMISRIQEYQGRLEGLVNERTARMERTETGMQAILETVLCGIVTIDADGRIQTFNPAAERLFGYSREEVNGQPVTLLMPPDIAARHDGFVGRYTRTGHPHVIGAGREVTGRRKDGSVFPLDLAVADMGREGFVGVLNDISLRKEQERQLKDYSRGLKEIHRLGLERYRDYNALLEDYLATGCQILGFSTGIVSEIAGGNYTIRAIDSDLDIGAGTQMPVEASYCILVLEEKKTIAVPRAGAHCRLKGHPVYLDLRLESYVGTPIYVNGRVYGTLNFSSLDPRPAFQSHELEIVEVMARGIGVFLEREKARKALISAKDAAEDANRIKADFLAMMSHELKTPLAVMDSILQEFARVELFTGARGISRLIRRLPEGVRPEARTALNTLLDEITALSEEGRNAGERLLALIQDSLDFSRIEAGRLKIRYESVPLAQVLAESVREIRPLSQAKHLEIRTEFQELRVRADPNRLFQIMANLLSNAVKFTEAGRIMVRAWEEKGCAVVSVSDTGCGIPPEKQGAVFSAFEQVDMSATRKYGGTGLGMAITRELLILMGGDIWFESHPGKGSTFTFTLHLDTGRDAGMNGK